MWDRLVKTLIVSSVRPRYQASKQGTGSPIELLWTARNTNIHSNFLSEIMKLLQNGGSGKNLAQIVLCDFIFKKRRKPNEQASRFVLTIRLGRFHYIPKDVLVTVKSCLES